MFVFTAVKFSTSLRLKQDKKKEIELSNTGQKNYRRLQTQDFIYLFIFGSLQSKGTWMVLPINKNGVETCLVPMDYFPFCKLIHDLVHHDGLPLGDKFGQGQSSCPRALANDDRTLSKV